MSRHKAMLRRKETSRVVHYTEIDTLAKRADLYLRMKRKLENRFGRSDPCAVEEHEVRLACCWRSARGSIEITLWLFE